MNAVQLVAHILKRGVQLWLDGGELRFRGPKDALDPATRSAVAEKRQDLINLLQPGRRYAQCSFAQQRLWFFDQLQPGLTAYTIPVAARLEGPLDHSAFERSLNAIIARQEALRTSFVEFEGSPFQAICGDVRLALTVTDFRHLPAGEAEAAAMAEAERELAVPFDLSQPPLMRARLLKLGAESHILLAPVHHIVSDGWSVGVFLRELSALYAAAAAGQPAPLASLDTQYSDYARWQRREIGAGALDDQIAYWKRQLEGPLPVLNLLTDHARPGVQTFRGARCAFSLAPDLTERVKAFSRDRDATVFMTLLAAFQALLHRYTGQKDIIVGSPVAGRERSDSHPLIGFFVNALALRSRTTAETSFAAHLASVRRTVLDAMRNQSVPFDRLVEEVQRDRFMSHTPVFQVMFALQTNLMPEQVRLGAVTLRPYDVDGGIAKFDFSVLIREADGMFKGWVEYNTDLFDAGTMERMMRHYETLLRAALDAPDTLLTRLDIMPPDERRRVLDEWNDTDCEVPVACAHQWVERQAAERPDALAVSEPGRAITFGRLNARANQLAHFLQTRGVKAEELVGICLERGIDAICAMLAVLKAGGAYVPLDPSYPKDRLAFMLENSGARLLITNSDLLGCLPSYAGETLCLVEHGATLAHEPTANPVANITPQNRAYVIYTSGSTGRPKGVEIEHRGLVNLVAWHHREYNVCPDDRASHVAGLSFDASVWEVWAHLTAGASVHIPDEDTRLSPEKLVQWLVNERITLSFLPTQLAEAVLETTWPADVPLRALLTGGDRLHRGPRNGEPFLFANHYGPTENTVITTWARVKALTNGSAPPIGRPIANTKVYVLDANLQPAPIGVPGELYVSGVGLARGYLNQPDLTGERFIPNPFCGNGAARLYRTGDLARYLPNGEIEFLGRLDRQVKLRGFRVELGEIETVLDDHPAVHESVVDVLDTPQGHRRLVAYFVPSNGGISSDELRSHLRERLPEFMVPSAFVSLKTLPVTPNGKVDRSALPDLEPEQSAACRYVTPSTETECLIARFIGELLGLAQVGADDNFFDLGGHSLLATQLIARIRDAFEVDMPLRRLFEAPTVAELAVAVEDTVLEQIEALSGEEARQLLSADTPD